MPYFLLPPPHTQSRQHWAFPEDREKAPHLERIETSPFLLRCGKRLQAAWWFRVSRQVAGPYNFLLGEKLRRGCSVGGSQISRWPGTQASACLHWGKETAWPGPQPCSQMFWMILQAADEFAHRLALVAYSVHSHEQREPGMGRERPSLASLYIPHFPSPPNPLLSYSPTLEFR